MLSLFKRRARPFGLCLLVLLGGCGGGDGSGTPLVGGGASSPARAVPAAIDVVAANTTVGTGGDGVLIRAFVKDSNNNALPETAVAFRASTGTLSSVSATTDTSGLASATLSAGGLAASIRAAPLAVAGRGTGQGGGREPQDVYHL